MSKLERNKKAIVERMKNLARNNFAPRAENYDTTATFPGDNIDDLFQVSLHAPTIPQSYGGLGLGPQCGDPLTLWLMTKEIAKVDLSLAQLWEEHANALVLLDGMASEKQKSVWFQEIVDECKIWVVWDTEPQANALGTTSFATVAKPVESGYIVDATKEFCIGANGANWAILVASESDSEEDVLLLACDLSDPSISIDKDRWDPLGMRAAVSHKVHFKKTFIPTANVIGRKGQYTTEAWQSRLLPNRAASLLGAAKAAYEHAVTYIKAQKKTQDPSIQEQIAQIAIHIETGDLWLTHTAEKWRENPKEAQLTSGYGFHTIENLVEDTLKRCIHACGAGILNRPSPIERIYRDLPFYIHRNEHNLARMGKAILGEL